MEIQCVKLVYFSPTGTTKSVLLSISKGLNCENIEQIDITKSNSRKCSLPTKENELLIVGIPVYMGRVPAVIIDWLHSIKGNKTPTVGIVVYGNRAYDNALLELNDILTNQGCIPIAGGAFIGEHSFHSPELPSASEGRPDESDKNQATLFGKKIYNRLQISSSVSEVPKPTIPGSHPYGGVTKMWDIDFIDVNRTCTQCGLCGDSCPTGAIDMENNSLIDHEKCTLCCACIKNCPQHARTIKPGLMKDAAIRVHKLFRERKEPEVFF